MANANRTKGLSARDVARPGFTAPALAAQRVVRYRLTVIGKGAAPAGNLDRHRASGTVTVTVRAAPAVTTVALTSVPQADATYQAGETIEVSVTFSAPMTVTGTPTIGIEVGTETHQAVYARNAGPAVLLFSYAVVSGDTDDDGIAVPADGILLAGGTIAGSHGVALLGHDAVATNAAHKVDGDMMALTGGVCERTPQVRDALVAKADVDNCLLVTATVLADLVGTLQLSGRGIAALKAGDFKDLDEVTGLDLSGNALSALPAGVFDDEEASALPKLTALHLNSNGAGRGRTAGRGVRKADRADDARPAPEPGQRELRADGRRGEERRRTGARNEDPGRGGHGRGSMGGERRLRLGSRWRHRATRWQRQSARRASRETDKARSVFTAPVLTEERVLHYRLTVIGEGAATRGAVNRHRASATVQVTVRAGPALIRGGGDVGGAALRHRQDGRGDGKFRGGGDGDRRFRCWRSTSTGSGGRRRSTT